METHGYNTLSEIPNPPNPWNSSHVEWLEEIPEAKVRVYRDKTASILTENKSPDLAFRWSVNPYRGCSHACAYCYARPSHEYMGLGAGIDFDSRIFIKENAAALLRDAFRKPSWTGERVVFSGVTDPYQPLEASYTLTRQCLEVCIAARNPVSLITKGVLVERDIDLLSELVKVASVRVFVSIPFFNGDLARRIEPRVPSPQRRFKMIRALTEAGIPVGVSLAPIMPGLNDMEIPMILARAREAGAQYSMLSLVRLPGSVEAVFRQRLARALPMRSKRVLNQIQDCRTRGVNESRFGARMHGVGARWNVIDQLYQKTRKRLGYVSIPPEPETSSFRRPPPGNQLPLF